jgi:hypothetical protein
VSSAATVVSQAVGEEQEGVNERLRARAGVEFVLENELSHGARHRVRDRW